MLGQKNLILTIGMESGASLRAFPRVGQRNGIAESESLNRELLKTRESNAASSQFAQGQKGQKPNLPERGKKAFKCKILQA